MGGLPDEPWWDSLDPIKRQLLGGIRRRDGDRAWGHYPEDTPLYVELSRRGLLDASHPPLIP